MGSTEVSNAWISLSGHEATPAHAELIYRSPRTRATRALVAVFGFWALGPIVFFLPPHIPWVLLAFGAGIYFGLKQWRGEYTVVRLEGTCPRCQAKLEVSEGSRIRVPLRMDCFQCHHEPVLHLTPPGGGRAAA